MADTPQEKTEQPTAFRKRKSRQDGNVAQSPEVFNALLLLGLVLFFRIYGKYMYRRLANDAIAGLRNIQFELTPMQTQSLFAEHAYRAFLLFLPFGVMLLFLVFLSTNIQFGWLVSAKSLKWKFDFLNIEKGFKQMFTLNKLKELGKSLLIILALLLVSYLTVRSRLEEFLGLIDLSAYQIFQFVGDMVLRLLTNVLLAYLLIAPADFALTKYLHTKKLKMSKSEVKDEMKQLIGDPQIRNRMRHLMMEEGRKRMMGEVPEADVVITNPTHIACALKYNPDAAQAPVLVAKGKRLIAEQIKEIAREHNIPIIENKPLARMIYSTTKVGQEIGMELYSAVAEILAYIYRMKNKTWGN
ncbi:MAG: flagellar biosynthesis protein FlhB [Candidatus Cloacimonetes bacterium]|nr:flagellar biosynthesis protein FlhB [Candidatus Cloacimonadota bacterium]